MKTRAEIDKLILDWREDPCWELEDTEGFEDHRTELLGVRMECEAKWKAPGHPNGVPTAYMAPTPYQVAFGEHTAAYLDAWRRLEAKR